MACRIVNPSKQGVAAEHAYPGDILTLSLMRRAVPVHHLPALHAPQSGVSWLLASLRLSVMPWSVPGKLPGAAACPLQQTAGLL